MTDSAPDSAMPELPPGAMRLGWAAVMPFAALATAAWWPSCREPAAQAFPAYGALITVVPGRCALVARMAVGAATGQFAAVLACHALAPAGLAATGP